MDCPRRHGDMCLPMEGFSPKIRKALTLLAEAHGYAQDTGCDVWQFAIEIHTFEAMGLVPNDFRWLLRKRYVEHAGEETKAKIDDREFHPCRDQTLCDRSCFILTDAGLALIRRVPDAPEASAANTDSPTAVDYSQHGSLPQPHWNAELRELNFNGSLIKCFKSPAPNQEIVLCAFEEDGWVPRIDDPLPQRAGQEQDPKRRLNDTVRSLNRSQKNHLIRFTTDGTGEGVRWEWVNDDSSGGRE